MLNAVGVRERALRLLLRGTVRLRASFTSASYLPISLFRARAKKDVLFFTVLPMMMILKHRHVINILDWRRPIITAEERDVTDR